jgi:hypothetical protein
MKLRSRGGNTAVGIATGYRLNGSGIEFRGGGGGGFFESAHPHPGVHTASSKMGTGSNSRR